jgi:hypothetical protein
MISGIEIDDTLDLPNDSGDGNVAIDKDGGTIESQSQEGDLQDRMSEGIDDDAWYSESTGAVVDKEGNAFINPKTGQPFKSMAEYEAITKEKPPTAEPKIEKNITPTKPDSRSFEQYVNDQGKMDAKTLIEMTKAGQDYKYADELVPAIDPTVRIEKTITAKTPVQIVDETRKAHEDLLLGPMSKIMEALIATGASEAEANAFMQPFISEQKLMIDNEYRRALSEALKEEAQNEIKPVLTKNQEAELKANSESNVSKLASVYFPKGGKDAFMALVNGYNAVDANGRTSFVRGPAAPVFDLMVNIVNGDKKFASNEELTNAYRGTFLQLTANPVTARAFFDLAHTYYKGKNIALVYNQGKEKGAEQQSNIRKFIKPKPQSQVPGVDDSDDPNMPKMLKTVLNNRGHFA